MIVSGANNLSEDSEDEVDNGEVDIYRRKNQLLLERCEVLQQDNERLVHRIQQVRKMRRRFRKERKFLMDRLDSHGDNWRNVQLPIPLVEPPSVPPPNVIKSEKIQHQKASPASTPKSEFVFQSPAANEKAGRKSSGSAGNSSSKRKNAKNSERAERDPNAPKRPANPFFQFCQEQRPIVMERLGSEKVGDSEPSKQELTRQLASKWNMLTPEDKKVYYDMYEKSKEKYAAEMQLYSNRTKSSNEDILS